MVLIDYLGGCAKEDVLRHPDEVCRDFEAPVFLLRRVFGPWETVTSVVIMRGKCNTYSAMLKVY